MSFAWTRRAALGGLLLTACSASSSTSPPGPPAPNADAGADASIAAAITFSARDADLCPDRTQVCAQPSTDLTIGVTAAGEITLALEGDYADGCVDVLPLAPSPTPHDVPVDVFDLPMALDKTDLDASFTFATDSATASGWQAALAKAAQRVEAGFFASGSEAGALLDAVRGTIASSADQQAFDTARSQNGWDAATTDWLGAKSLH